MTNHSNHNNAGKNSTYDTPRNFKPETLLNGLIDACITDNVAIEGVRLLTATASLARNRPEGNQEVRYVDNTNHRIMVEFDKVSKLGRLETGSCYVAKDNEEVMRNHLKIRLRCRNKNMLAKEATKLQSEINYIRGFLIPVHNVDYSSREQLRTKKTFYIVVRNGRLREYRYRITSKQLQFDIPMTAVCLKSSDRPPNHCNSCGGSLTVMIPYESSKELSDFYYKEVICKIIHDCHISDKCIYNQNQSFGHAQTNVGENGDDWTNQRQQCLDNQRANGECILSQHFRRN